MFTEYPIINQLARAEINTHENQNGDLFFKIMSWVQNVDGQMLSGFVAKWTRLLRP
jgi:hypothetical protein